MERSVFASLYPGLYAKAAAIQRECFPCSARERGAAFYALEACGEAGELLNAAKKFLRTASQEKRRELVLTALPEEAADTAIALTMLAQSLEMVPEPGVPKGPEPELHPLLCRLAAGCARLYGEALAGSLRLPDFSAPLGDLESLSHHFGFDLGKAMNRKLDIIAQRAKDKHYE